MYAEEDFIWLSALQHLAFCERQWGLIHLENLWNENRLTAEGRHFHDRPDNEETEVRGNIRIARGLRLRSLRLGLTGKADVVEFHRLCGDEPVSLGVALEGVNGLWKPVPVEYKRGRPKADSCDEVQVCAQAFCLEEMMKVEIPQGFLYYGVPKRRAVVFFDNALRKNTEELCGRLRELTARGKTPPAKYEKRCERCSLLEQCMPKIIGKDKKVQKYLENILSSGEGEE
ncbi:CRISPR-associated protein Cas4 [bacterium]|nr:CRISPR-associated protein Cas4 [bacterium]MBU3954828.1 CRISPR-associated protein Cas4 [bacterium]MBU4134085.1 CRISPR-associated protein Cas4 [bacterium]